MATARRLPLLLTLSKLKDHPGGTRFNKWVKFFSHRLLNAKIKLSGLQKATKDRSQFHFAKQPEIHLRSELGAANRGPTSIYSAEQREILSGSSS